MGRSDRTNRRRLLAPQVSGERQRRMSSGSSGSGKSDVASASVDFARLWAPWRTAFLTQPRARRCVFCTAKRFKRDDRRHHVIDRGRRVFALLNLYPYNNGHLMIAPYRHIGAVPSLDPAEWTEMHEVGCRLMERLSKTIHPHGFNIGLNVGRVSGAGIPGHLHLHIVPRWLGDANFISILGNTRVISQSLNQLYHLLTTTSQD